MIRALLLTAAVLTCACHKNTPPAGEAQDASAGTDVTRPAPSTGTPPADAAPAPTVTGDRSGTSTTVSEEPPHTPPPQPRPAGDAMQAVEEEPGSTGGGRLAKPGWCDDDDDCSKGSVCEKCGPEGQCVPGCHNNSQCGEGEYCNQVQCIRCPCPGICEKRS